jgi:hypothetical protein
MTLSRHKALLKAVSGMLSGQLVQTLDTFYRLRSAGIIKGESANDANFRCELYESYFRKNLPSLPQR